MVACDYCTFEYNNTQCTVSWFCSNPYEYYSNDNPPAVLLWVAACDFCTTTYSNAHCRAATTPTITSEITSQSESCPFILAGTSLERAGKIALVCPIVDPDPTKGRSSTWQSSPFHGSYAVRKWPHKAVHHVRRPF